MSSAGAGGASDAGQATEPSKLSFFDRIFATIGSEQCEGVFATAGRCSKGAMPQCKANLCAACRHALQLEGNNYWRAEHSETCDCQDHLLEDARVFADEQRSQPKKQKGADAGSAYSIALSQPRNIPAAPAVFVWTNQRPPRGQISINQDHREMEKHPSGKVMVAGNATACLFKG